MPDFKPRDIVHVRRPLTDDLFFIEQVLAEEGEETYYRGQWLDTTITARMILVAHSEIVGG